MFSDSLRNKHTGGSDSSSPDFAAHVSSYKLPEAASARVHDAWMSSRAIPHRRGAYLVPGAQRPLNKSNLRLAYIISRECVFDLLEALWALHPVRTTLMMFMNILRGLFPAFRGYSQAMIVDELQALISTGRFTWSRLVKLMITEGLRRVLESIVDSFATSNENLVHDSVRFFVEYRQVAQRLRLDIPTLTDPQVRDCLQESELFVRSFNGMGAFGLLSPFDFIQIFSLISELVAHVWVLFSLTGGSANMGALGVSIISAMLPLLLNRCGFGHVPPDSSYAQQEARAAERQEKLRSLAYSDTHRPEIQLFGLGPWILQSWANVRKSMLYSERSASSKQSTLPTFIGQINVSDLLFALQNIPLLLILQSSASLGSLALYRSSIQSVVFTLGHLLTTIRMAFQGIFLMGAFCAAMNVKPRLDPLEEKMVSYQPLPQGMSIEVRNLSYTYPGNSVASLRNVNFRLEAGDSLAIVGYNGSGKSTLAKILLRIIDFDSGELAVNGIDMRRINPREYHRHVTTVFQGFSKFNSTVRENVGVGYVQKLGSHTAIEHAVHLAGADSIVSSLPNGLKTKLDASGCDTGPFSSCTSANNAQSSRVHHGLSGGEWQRIAISRAFMRADRPEIDLLLFDEPTSSLDAHAQNKIFDTIESISRLPSGERTKTVIFITHRLSTARRADKIAMMDSGTITEFGTHEELLAKCGSYAALYKASV